MTPSPFARLTAHEQQVVLAALRRYATPPEDDRDTVVRLVAMLERVGVR